MDAMAKEVIVKKYLSFIKRAEKHEISWKKAALLIGGEKRLERMMERGKIRYSKPEGSANTMWRFNLADIVANGRPNPDLTKFPLDDPRMSPTLASYGVKTTPLHSF